MKHGEMPEGYNSDNLQFDIPEEQTVEYLQECLKRMYYLLTEKRSDIMESIESILDNVQVEDTFIFAEHRYVNFNYQGADFLYDTLTTLVETNGKPLKTETDNRSDSEWKVLKCGYYDDGEEVPETF